MLDVGFSELFLIVVVGLIVIKPKDLPVVVRHVMGFIRELRSVYHGLKTQMHQVMEEAGMDEVRREVTTIIDMHGIPQTAYDVRDLASLGAPKAVMRPLEPPPSGAPEAAPPAGIASTELPATSGVLPIHLADARHD